MKKLFWNIMFIMAILLPVAGMFSCEKDKGGDDGGVTNNDELYQSILSSYIESTIIPTYKSLAEAALEMRTANEKLKSDPSDANMKAASDAWMTARVAWEISEAFLFGPVGEQALDIDGHIDSWPLELDQILETLNQEAADLTGEKAWAELDAEVIGFHVTEYLLYRDGQTRPVGDLSEAELKYLTAATDALVWDCVLAYVAWVGENAVAADIRAVFNENSDIKAHLDANASYREFAKKLSPQSTGGNYTSWADALSEIAVGAAEIAGEVGATKIAEPYENHRTEDVESWYSWHSLDDYQNNILSIKNAYLGGMADNSRTTVCLSAYIATVNAALDRDIKAKIEDCLTKIKAIGTGGLSFYEVVRDQINGEQVDAAVEACIDLQELFDRIPEIIE
ncbi:MAG: hypothetical protein LBR86_01905 [Tannerella sp.]|jgi:hypothetical protein|nr:hypothetical protein [Tannerella sp.]